MIYDAVVGEAWRCLACDKLHPSDPSRAWFVCSDCQTAGWGHADGFALCRDCTLERLAGLDPDSDVDAELLEWPLIAESVVSRP